MGRTPEETQKMCLEQKVKDAGRALSFDKCEFGRTGLYL